MNNEDLQAALWIVFNNGRMPTGLRMAYQLYCDLMKGDDEFNEAVELPSVECDNVTYQGLTITFDPWYKTQPYIESVVK